MNNKEEIHIQEDKEIRDLLVSQGVIDHHRVVKCGRFTNKIYSHKFNEPFTTNKSYQFKCGRWSCRVCRRDLINTQRKKHYRNNIQFINRNGQVLLFTLTIHHTVKDKLSSLLDGFQKSLRKMKQESYGWKKIKKITNLKFHYNTIELTEVDNGYHLHSHITVGVLNDVSLSTIENILFDTWSKITKRMGLDNVSRKSVDVKMLQGQLVVIPVQLVTNQ